MQRYDTHLDRSIHSESYIHTQVRTYVRACVCVKKTFIPPHVRNLRVSKVPFPCSPCHCHKVWSWIVSSAERWKRRMRVFLVPFHFLLRSFLLIRNYVLLWLCPLLPLIRSTFLVARSPCPLGFFSLRVRGCVRAWMRGCVRACVRACERARVCACVPVLSPPCCTSCRHYLSTARTLP